MAKKLNATRNFGDSASDKTKIELACSRLALTGDLGISSSDKVIMNIQTVKDHTGGAAGSHGKVSVTCVMSADTLFSCKQTSRCAKADRARRTVVVPASVHEDSE
jgi:hypothetical protein